MRHWKLKHSISARVCRNFFLAYELGFTGPSMDNIELTTNHIHSIHQVYSSTSFNPPAFQYTITASFFLTHPSSPDCKVISVATGTKCLPTTRLPSRGEAVHDSHAEILARRGAIRWFLEEIGRCHHDTKDASSHMYQSDWICQSSQDGRYELRADVQIHLYVSTVPCTIIERVSSDLVPSCSNLSRWRCFHTFVSLYARRKYGNTQGLYDHPSLQSRSYIKRPRRLFSLRCTPHQTWPRGFAANPVHVVQRQSRVVERPRISGCISFPFYKTALSIHDCHRGCFVTHA